MALLQVVTEECIEEEHFTEYFDQLYTVVCVGERLDECEDVSGEVVRTTYLVDWEQLVHLLEGYAGLGEDIVEVRRLDRDEARNYRSLFGSVRPARA